MDQNCTQAGELGGQASGNRRRRPARLAAFLAVCIGACSLSACGTIGSQVEYWVNELDDDLPLGMVYSGVGVDVLTINRLNACTSILLVPAIIDIPFSFCLDTALLPLTIIETLASGE